MDSKIAKLRARARIVFPRPLWPRREAEALASLARRRLQVLPRAA